MSSRSARIVLSAAAALWGVAIAIALFPVLIRAAPPDQLPGALKALNIDARTPFRFFAVLVCLPLIAPTILLPVIRRLEGADVRRWARNTAVIAMLTPLWVVTIERNLVWSILPTAAVLICVVLMRHVEGLFSRHDAILLPVLATVFLAIVDIVPFDVHKQFLIAAAIVLAARIAILFTRSRGALNPAACFAISPLALMLQSAFFARDQRHFGWPPLILAVATPFLMSLLIRDTAAVRIRIRRLIAFVIFPIAAYAYSSATSIQAAEGKPRADLFESSHTILPGGEMLRGEKPYRDIIPAHGLVADSLLSYAALRTGPVTIGRALKVQGTVEGLNRPAEYFIGLAATGSPEAAVLSFFLGEALGTNGGAARALPALVTISLLVAAVRRRKVRYLAAAGVAVIASIVTGVDFGIYAGIVALIAALLFRRRWVPAFRALASGAAAALVVVVAGLAIYGILPYAFRYLFFEMPKLTAAYTLPPVVLPEGLKRFLFPPEILVAVFDKTSFHYVLWFIVLIGLAVSTTIRIDHERWRARIDALRIMAAFAAICAISYAERHHLYFQYVMAPMIGAALLWMFRSRHSAARKMAPVLVVVAIMIAEPTIHIAIVAGLRNARGPIDPGFREVAISRARGAYFNETNARAIEAAANYLNGHMRSDETFFDFTNRGTLFFLLDRDCPIRQVEPAFYETEQLQREVIARIESNALVRAALIPPEKADGFMNVDGVPNSVRAPLVWAYLQQHFQPDFSEGDVVFWRRRQ